MKEEREKRKDFVSSGEPTKEQGEVSVLGANLISNKTSDFVWVRIDVTVAENVSI